MFELRKCLLSVTGMTVILTIAMLKQQTHELIYILTIQIIIEDFLHRVVSPRLLSLGLDARIVVGILWLPQVILVCS